MVSVGRILSVVVLVVCISALGNAQQDCQDTVTQEGQRRCLRWLINNKANSADLNKKADRTELDTKADTKDLDTKATTNAIANIAKDLETVKRSLGFDRDRFWVLLSALLVFFMQAGFLCLEVGMVRKEFDILQAAYKLFSWIATYAGYFFIGFGIMFSTSGERGLFGWNWPLWPANVINEINNNRGMEFFLFQAAFAATAVTIPAGAAAERISLRAYFLIGIFIALIAYPIFGHWAWGGSLHAEEFVVQNPSVQGWLRRLGFHDFAGSTVVHSIGGWFALAIALALGPRTGRFLGNGAINLKDFPSSSRGYAVLGVFLLWFGWWGFNGGSQLKYDPSIAIIILNTNIAGAAAGFAAWAFARWQKKWWEDKPWFHRDGFIPEKVIGGVLGGLVAITASCDRADSPRAFLIGLSAGIIHNLVFDLLLRLKIDDPVGAVPVHLGCGVWGTLCVAFTYPDFGKQVTVQLAGVLSAGAWAFVTAWLCIYGLKQFRLLKPTDKARISNLWLGALKPTVEEAQVCNLEG
jgi:ammonium transporter, Amt family